MILYLDTSALVKAYVREKSSEEVILAMQDGDLVATNLIAYVEAHAAFSRLKKEKKINEKEYESIKSAFITDWENYMQIENTKQLLEQAADFSDAFSLRAYDSLHLAAATLLFRQSRQQLLFACFDQHLNRAAKILGLQLLAV